MLDLDPTITLGEAKELLRERLDEGDRCPCCTQRAQVYPRAVHSSMARGLIKLYRRQPVGSYHEILLFMSRNELGDFAKFVYWDLVAEQPSIRDDGSTRTGFWKITPAGVAFVEGTLTIAKYARVYDGRCLGLAGPQVSIRDCLGQKFNYAALMGHDASERALKAEEQRHLVSPSPVVSDGSAGSGRSALGHAALGGTSAGSSETTGQCAIFDDWDAA